MNSGNTVIIHFSPVEYYPPIQNLIKVLAAESYSETAGRVFVFTTYGTYKELKNFESDNTNIKIIRFGKSGNGIRKALRIYYYGLFYLGSLLYMLIKKPGKVLYYETMSSLPAIFYKRFVNKKTELFIHYHEYTTPEAYEDGMKLTRMLHKQEKMLYPFAKWVSHTNDYRMRLFEKDIFPLKILNPQIMPNYPSREWLKETKLPNKNFIKAVYVGSLSLDTMFTREFANWVLKQNGKVKWDIYSYNITNDARQFIQSLNSAFIELKGGTDYYELPSILAKYDAGIILYTGHIPNYVYNAPNKLFEYLACGLDVWFPDEMQGIHCYETFNTYPKVLKIDFKKMDNFILKQAINREECFLKMPSFFCEEALAPLKSELIC